MIIKDKIKKKSPNAEEHANETAIDSFIFASLNGSQVLDPEQINGSPL